jgi:hypothetical protein
VNKPVRRALAATTVSLALTVPMLSGPSAVADQSDAAAKAGTFVNYGMKGAASGARLIVNNVEVLNINDAIAPLRCTRNADKGTENRGTLTTPEGSPIQLSAVTNLSRTYKDGDRVGVRSTSTLGSIQIGDATGQLTGGVPTPEIRIDGLTTVADAFHDKDGYGHEESITDLDLSIDLLPGQDADQPLQDLLDAIEEAAGTQVIQPILDVLEENVGGIAIPDLGSISLGGMRGTANKHSAESYAHALEIVVDATGEQQRLVLGDVRSRIGGPAPAGVFQSTSMPLAVDVEQGVVRLGHVKPRPIPCGGTSGREKVKKLASASVVLPDGMIAGVTGVEYRSMGDQHNDGSAHGYEVSKIGSFSIPLLDLSIEGISSRVSATSKELGGRVQKTAKVSVGKIVYQGEEIAVPKPGQSRLVEGLGIIETRVVSNGSKYGQRVTALRLQLTEYGGPLIVFDLGNAATKISPF